MSIESRARNRARRDLTSASLLIAGAVAAPAWLAELLIGWPPGWWVLAVVVVVLVAGQLAGALPQARRRSADVLLAAVSFAGAAVAVVAGLVAWLLVAGRVPLGDPGAAERPLVAAALVALVATAVTGSLLAPALARRVRRRRAGAPTAVADVLSALPEQPAAAADGTAETAASREFLHDYAESVRRVLRLRSITVWAGDGRRLTPQLRLPAPLDTVEGRPDGAVLQDESLRVLARAGVAGPGWLSLWLPQEAELLHRQPADRPADQLRVAPAVAGSGTGAQVLALLVVTRGADDDPFGPGDERALAAVATRLAILLRNRTLDFALTRTLDELQIANAELRASRARLVATADAQRRALERDLHDGAQQHLVALAVTVNLLRSTMPEISADQQELLDELDAGVRSSIAELRSLAHGIYPPLLRDAGLGSALSAAARRSPVPVTVTVRLARRYPADVESAVYFSCLEALQNSAKYGEGSPVAITVSDGSDGDAHVDADADTLVFEVADEGPGFDPATVARGAGLTNMADRIGAIGGTLELHAVPGAGSAVRGRVPLGDPA